VTEQAGSEATSGDLGRRRGWLLCVDATRGGGPPTASSSGSRRIIEPSLSRHDGRLIKTTGDGALASSASPWPP